MQTPFHLTLRLWDIYVLEGDRLLVAMAYCVMKVHRRKFSHSLFACSLKKKIFQHSADIHDLFKVYEFHAQYTIFLTGTITKLGVSRHPYCFNVWVNCWDEVSFE